MTVIKRDAVVPYSPAQMYGLVDQIELYPEFVPWCQATEILSRNEDEVQARLHFARGALQRSFVTCNRLQQHKTIEMRLIEGPFHHLEGFWLFEALPEGCRITLDMEFEFSSKLMVMLFAPVFHSVADSLVDVFCQRARDLYEPAT